MELLLQTEWYHSEGAFIRIAEDRLIPIIRFLSSDVCITEIGRDDEILQGDGVRRAPASSTFDSVPRRLEMVELLVSSQDSGLS